MTGIHWQDRARMRKPFGAQTMVARLRRVMMRAPGAAMRAADPAHWHYGPGFDAERAEKQHAALAKLISSTGAEIVWLADSGGDRLADATFTQDPSFVTEAGAVICNMAKPLRRAEPALHRAAYRSLGIPALGEIVGPATLESGDCVWLDRQTLAIGCGFRSNRAGIAAVAELLHPLGITVEGFDLPVWKGPDACLHLMSVFSPLADGLALAFRPLLPARFDALLRDRGWRFVETPEEEFRAGNGISANVLATAPGEVIAVEGFPATRRAMEAAGCRVSLFEGDALCIACEGGPTCLTNPIWRAP
jgi:dimethylargininase